MRSPSNAVVMLLLNFALILAAAPLRAGQTTVYKNDFTGRADDGFAAGTSGGWSAGQTSSTPSGKYGQFLGEFGNQTASLTVTNLPSHDQVTVSFLLFILRSWDGNDSTWGPDIWSLDVGGGPTLLRTTFSKVIESGPAAPTLSQAYPGMYPGADFPAGTGSLEKNTLGYRFNGLPMDSVYALSYTFRHTDGALKLNFAGSHLQELWDESWGLDNVEIKVNSGLPSPSPSPPDLGLTASLARLGDTLFVVGTAANVGGAPAIFTLRSSTLFVFDPLLSYETSDPLPVSLGVLAPGEQRGFYLRYPGSAGPPGRSAALTISGIADWSGSPTVNHTLIFTRDFNSLTLP